MHEEIDLTQEFLSKNLSKRKPYKIFILIIGAIAILSGFAVVAYSFSLNQAKREIIKEEIIESKTTILNPTIVQKTSVVTSTIQPTTVLPSPIVDQSPVKNSLYLGTYKGKNLLFMRRFPGVGKDSPYTDLISLIEKDFLDESYYTFASYANVPYEDIVNPIRIASFDDKDAIFSIGFFVLDKETSKLYTILNIYDDHKSSNYPFNIRQDLYQIDLKTYTKKRLWTNKIGDGKYPKSGAADIYMIQDDKYAILYFAHCYACGVGDPRGALVVNLKTLSEKYLGEVGDFKFDIRLNRLYYRKLGVFREPCDVPAPGCDSDNTRSVYKPEGELIFVELP